MADNKKSTFTKVGAVLKKQGKPGVFVVLGNANAKKEEYRTEVEITVKDSKGKTIASSRNGFLTVLDPRKRKGITEEQAEKISDRLVSELFIVEDAKE